MSAAIIFFTSIAFDATLSCSDSVIRVRSRARSR